MRTKTVTVREYDPQWVSDFEAIAGELRCILAEHTLAIHHVGSTSVPGMAAKPIIDLDVVIADYSVFPAVLEKLKSIGYFHEGDLGIPNREAFCYDGKFHLRKHHLYVCPADSPELRRHLIFRDFLRSHPEAAAEYSQIKRDAAVRYPDDIDSYIRHKTPCIEKLYAECGLSQRTPAL